MPNDQSDLFEDDQVEQVAKDFTKFHDNLVSLAEKLHVGSTAIIVYEENTNSEDSGVEVFGFGKTRDLVFLANVISKVIKP